MMRPENCQDHGYRDRLLNAGMGRTVSAYFVFCDQHRAETKASLQADKCGEKVSVAQVAKALGGKWRQLPEEEKKQYQQQAAEQTRHANEHDEKENADPSKEVHTPLADSVFSLAELKMPLSVQQF